MKRTLTALAAGALVATGTAIAQTPEPPKTPTSWADKTTIKGDVRFRHESIEAEGKETRERERVRARLGIFGKPGSDLDLGVQFSTTEKNDPVSSNQTLGDGASRKDVFFDLAYMTWTPVSLEGLSLTGGKMENPFVTVSDLVFDGDLNPEGAAVNYTLGGDGLARVDTPRRDAAADLEGQRGLDAGTHDP